MISISSFAIILQVQKFESKAVAHASHSSFQYQKRPRVSNDAYASFYFMTKKVCVWCVCDRGC